MERRPMARREILALIEEERQLIMRRYIESEKLSSPLPLNDYVRWFTEICKQWAVHHLSELSRRAPGKLLDIGAFFGLIPGAAYRMGWRISAVDAYPMPAF